MQDRIKKLVQSSSSSFQNSQTISALYNSDDDESNEFQSKPLQQAISALKPKSDLIKLERQDELSDALLSESKMEESESLLVGKMSTNSYKIIDKSKRAFDTSVESTRALELAL